MNDLTWHQRRGVQRALGIHRWVSDDDGAQCITCGQHVADPDDHDLGRCPGPNHDTEGLTT